MTEPQERCEKTDLLVDQCACPKHRKGQTVQEQVTELDSWLLTQPGWIPARFAGRCAVDGTSFPEGAPIHRVDLGRGVQWMASCCAPEEER